MRLIYRVISLYRWDDQGLPAIYRSQEMARIVLEVPEHEDSHSCPACL